MTRKRFVKLIMSHGVSRNDAIKEAASIPRGKSYDGYFPLVRVGIAIERLSREAKSLGVSMTNLAVALMEFGQAVQKERTRLEENADYVGEGRCGCCTDIVICDELSTFTDTTLRDVKALLSRCHGEEQC